MKKVFVQLQGSFPVNVDIQNAIDGFECIGYDPVGYTLTDVASGKMDIRANRSPFVGSIDAMTILLQRIDKYPNPIDLPESVIRAGLLNRNITKMKLSAFIEDFKKNNKPRFVKPYQTKLFDGALISKIEHLSYLRFDDTDVWVSDPMDIVSEHRVYVKNGSVVYSCSYRGDFRICPDYDYVDSLIEAYEEKPVAFTIDVAVLSDGSTTVVEFNDFWAIGAYGLDSINYAEMLLSRYNEIVGISG